MDLQSLEILLGSDVFLVPCEWRTKKPQVTYVERPLLGSGIRDYLRRYFEKGVSRCGDASAFTNAGTARSWGIPILPAIPAAALETSSDG